MRRILPIVIGTRPDLNLRRRWWHRLALVAYTMLVVATGIVVALARGGVEAAELSASQRVVTADLLSFTEGFSGSGNPATAFNALDGWLGFDSEARRPTWLDVASALTKNQVDCKRGGRVHGAKEGAINVISVKPVGSGVRIVPMPNRQGDKSECYG